MPNYDLSALALEDLGGIWDYTAKTWGEAQAVRYTRGIEAACAALGEHEQAGQSAEHIRPGYRKLLEGKHTIYGRWTAGRLRIERILHQSMDVEEHLD